MSSRGGGVIAGMLGRQFPKVETLLLDAACDITAFADFPTEHWKKIWSTDESVNGVVVSAGVAPVVSMPAAAA